MSGQAVEQPREVPASAQGVPGTVSGRARVRRLPGRADYSPASVADILDEALVAHVGIVADGQPFVIPMVHVRAGERLYLHGSVASRLMRALRRGPEVCVTVTLLDGLVLARSAFHHSMNYRSVVVLGRAAEVIEPAERSAAFAAFVHKARAGRTAGVRPPDAKELAATLLVSVPLDEASAKVRTGPPVDDEDDHALAVWAGVVPLALVAGEPEPDERCGTPWPS